MATVIDCIALVHEHFATNGCSLTSSIEPGTRICYHDGNTDQIEPEEAVGRNDLMVKATTQCDHVVVVTHHCRTCGKTRTFGGNR